MREKFYSFTFYAEKSACLQLQNKNALTFSADLSRLLCAEKYIPLTFSADLQALCTPETFFWIPPHLYNGIKSRVWANMHSTFYTLVTSKQKILSLIQRNSEVLWPPKFLAFYKSFTNGEKTPLTFNADSEALWANIFSLLLQAKKKAPHFTRDFRSTLTTLKSFFLQIVHIRTHTRLKEGSLENFSYLSLRFLENPWFYWGFWVFLCTLREAFLAVFSQSSRIFLAISCNFFAISEAFRTHF